MIQSESCAVNYGMSACFMYSLHAIFRVKRHVIFSTNIRATYAKRCVGYY